MITQPKSDNAFFKTIPVSLCQLALHYLNGLNLLLVSSKENPCLATKILPASPKILGLNGGYVLFFTALSIGASFSFRLSSFSDHSLFSFIAGFIYQTFKSSI